MLTTKQTIATYYRVKATCSGSGLSATSTPVYVTMSSATITTQPVAPTATCSGSGTQTISVGATGTGLMYQWRRNSVNLNNDAVISNATTATLTLTNPTVANAGNYDVVITGACSSTITSNPVAVTVNALPTITTAATPAVVIAVCQSASAQSASLIYTATTNSPTSYSIDWNAAANTAGLADQGSTAYAFVAGGGTLNSIAITAGTPAGTYTGTMTITTVY